MYNKYFKQFVEDRNLRKSTIEGYKVSLKLYSQLNNMTLNELINEALFEEEKKYQKKNRQIRKRLLDFRRNMINSKMSQNTIKTYLTKVKTFYKHFGVEVPLLPSVKYPDTYQINYSDLPTKNHIIEVFNMVQTDYKALILFMSSSGTAKAETLSLTIKDFLDACSGYYKSTTLEGILNELSIRDDVVPTIYLKRIKTGKYYFTFCSPEATSYIVKYLKSREELSFSDKLFPFSNSSVTRKFQQINDYMKWGRKGKYRFFRTHILRKYHASNIGLPAEYIDALQGRQKSIVHDAYIKTNPEYLKELYIMNMKNVMLFKNELNTTEEKIEEIHITINIFMSDMQLTL